MLIAATLMQIYELESDGQKGKVKPLPVMISAIEYFDPVLEEPDDNGQARIKYYYVHFHSGDQWMVTSESVGQLFKLLNNPAAATPKILTAAPGLSVKR